MSHQICPACGLPKFSGVVGYSGPMCQCQWKPIPRWESNTDDRRKQLEEKIDRLIKLLEEKCVEQGANDD